MSKIGLYAFGDIVTPILNLRFIRFVNATETRDIMNLNSRLGFDWGPGANKVVIEHTAMCLLSDYFARFPDARGFATDCLTNSAAFHATAGARLMSGDMGDPHPNAPDGIDHMVLADAVCRPFARQALSLITERNVLVSVDYIARTLDRMASTAFVKMP